MSSTQDARADVAYDDRGNDQNRQEAEEGYLRAGYVAFISDWFARSEWLDIHRAAPDLDTWLRVVVNFAYRYLQTIQDRANVLCEELMLPGTHALTFDVWSLHPRNPVTHQPYLIPVIPMRSVIRLEEADRGYLIQLLLALAVGKTITERMTLQLELRAMHGRKVRMAARHAVAEATYDT